MSAYSDMSRAACEASGAESAIRRNCDLVSGFVKSGRDNVDLLKRAALLAKRMHVALENAVVASEEVERMEAEAEAKAESQKVLS